MFAAAYAIAKNFTMPLIISYRKHSGVCEAAIGTMVIINEDGWFVTAFHIFNEINKLANAVQEYNELISKRMQIEGNTQLKNHEKNKRLSSLKIPPESITNISYLIGQNGWRLNPQAFVLQEVDLAVGQISNFDKNAVPIYPKFKNPVQPMEPGTSLCKLGFPFHVITPTFDAQTGFILPNGALPVPLFPIEGIFTRNVLVNTQNPVPHPLMYIETSSPGLRGQSGGPTFDVNGNIWAIQSSTTSYKLGFGAQNSNGTTKEKEHLANQYFNVGLGIHAKTIVSFLTEKKVSFQFAT